MTWREPTLLISGVDASRTAAQVPADEPMPDYVALKASLPLDVVDPRTVVSIHHPLIERTRRTLGINWAIALAAFLRLPRYAAVLAAGEDVGLRLALLMRYLPRRRPLILTCHNISGRRSTFFFRALRVAPAIRLFQCLSRAQRATLQARYGVPTERLQVIDWHVDHQFFAPLSAVPTRRQICSAGMASRDYATLIKATSGLDVDVKIAADSPWFRQTLNISAGDLGSRVEVRSFGTYGALRQLYAESLFVVVPLLDVDFAAGYTVILEAMAMGKAVIVSKIRQKDDFVVDGENGYYVAPGDITGLSARISYLLDHPREAIGLGTNGRRMVEERFTLSRYVRYVDEALHAVTAGTTASLSAEAGNREGTGSGAS